MNPRELILGIDGGGSKTRALIADLSGNVLGDGVGPSSNYHSVGFDRAAAALDTAVRLAWASVPGHLRGTLSEEHLPRFNAACFGLAGVEREADHTLMREWIDARGLCERYRLVNDSELVLAAGTPQGFGVALICGTGSICYGVAADGRRARAGGWGYLLGDEGSGYHIAIQGLRLATQTADGREEAQPILEAILAHWKLQTPEQLLGYCYRPDITVAEIAQLAPRILELARKGEPHAQQLFERTAAALAKMIDSVVKKLKLKRPAVAFGGGLLVSSRDLQKRIVEVTRAELGPPVPVPSPAHGALALAARLAKGGGGSTGS